MTELRIQSLKLQNFKGIKDLEVVADGADLRIRGDNASGKTSIADAWSWLLWGTDSRGRTDFAIKTLTSEGEPHHGLEHVVEAEISAGGRTRSLRRCYREKWVKRRGSQDQVMDGHETLCWIDGVPKGVREYEAAIDEVCSQDAWRLLTDPAVFASNDPPRWGWEDRRALLLAICGDVSDEGLDDLREVLEEGRSLEDAPAGVAELAHGEAMAEEGAVAAARAAVDCCEVLYDGVPYQSGLNRGHQALFERQVALEERLEDAGRSTSSISARWRPRPTCYTIQRWAVRGCAPPGTPGRPGVGVVAAPEPPSLDILATQATTTRRAPCEKHPPTSPPLGGVGYGSRHDFRPQAGRGVTGRQWVHRRTQAPQGPLDLCSRGLARGVGRPAVERQLARWQAGCVWSVGRRAAWKPRCVREVFNRAVGRVGHRHPGPRPPHNRAP